MAQQLLWIETLLKLTAGLVLVVLPLTAARVLGLPLPLNGLWARLLGAVLVGLAGATFLEGSVPGSRGLGLGGTVLINLSIAAVLISLQVLGSGSVTLRGTVVVWGLAVGLLGLSLVEIAVA